MNPRDCRYSREHEWVRVEGGVGIVGITEYAQEQLGDVVYIDLPRPGTQVSQSGKMGEIESVKAVSDLFSPVSGKVVEINEEVLQRPELVNKEPYVRGWLVKVALSNPAELHNLLTAEEYERFLGTKAP